MPSSSRQATNRSDAFHQSRLHIPLVPPLAGRSIQPFGLEAPTDGARDVWSPSWPRLPSLTRTLSAGNRGGSIACGSSSCLRSPRSAPCSGRPATRTDAGPAEAPAPDASESQPVGEPDEASTDEGAAALEQDTASEQAAPVVPVDASPALVEAFGGRVFARPIDLVSLDGGRFLVAEQNGVVLLIGADGSATTFLDLRERVSRASNEEGLLSLALDPPFADPGYLWLYYSVAGGQRTRLSRFSITGAAAAAEPGSELVILEIPQPFANHNGGAVRFGPDGMLYLGLGDGGAGGDPRDNGQNRSTLLGSIIRIDVQNPSPSAPYTRARGQSFRRSGRRAAGDLGLRRP